VKRKHPIIIGLTGGVGMGKSTVANALARMGVPVHRADETVHALLAPGGAAVGPVAQHFPPALITQGGARAIAAIDRKKLGAMVFNNPPALRGLEKILHPMVAASRKKFLRQHARARVVVFDIPLLFEAGLQREVDEIWLLVATPRVQRQRVLARAGMTSARLHAILRQQWPHARKIKNTRGTPTRIIRTDGARKQWQHTVAKLLALCPRA